MAYDGRVKYNGRFELFPRVDGHRSTSSPGGEFRICFPKMVFFFAMRFFRQSVHTRETAVVLRCRRDGRNDLFSNTRISCTKCSLVRLLSPADNRAVHVFRASRGIYAHFGRRPLSLKTAVVVAELVTAEATRTPVTGGKRTNVRYGHSNIP